MSASASRRGVHASSATADVTNIIARSVRDEVAELSTVTGGNRAPQRGENRKGRSLGLDDWDIPSPLEADTPWMTTWTCRRSARHKYGHDLREPGEVAVRRSPR